MSEITFTLADLVWILGGIASLFGVYKAYLFMKKPSNDLKTQVEKHEQFLVNDYKNINDIMQGQKVMCTSLFAIIDNEISGNSKGELLNAKKELNEYLINK